MDPILGLVLGMPELNIHSVMTTVIEAASRKVLSDNHYELFGVSNINDSNTAGDK